MTRVLIDNNVAIDALKPNESFEAEAKNVFKLIWHEIIDPYMCANSLTDIFYVLQKVQGSSNAKASIANLMTVMNIIPLSEKDCSDALALPFEDFEDAIIAVCAEKAGVDYIVSRDNEFIKAKTAVEVITPGQLLEIIATRGEAN